MPDLSIIIPVFGVEKYIGQCAQSLFAQTRLKDVEIIVVDDCTQDRSIEIFQAELSKHPELEQQVRIIRHAENKGLAAARKTGFEVSHGRYIFNLDSDDWLEPHAIETFLSVAERESSDIVVCDAFYCKEGVKNEFHQQVRPQTFVKDMLQSRNIWAVWNKMFRRSLYSEPTDIVFPISYMGEDIVQVYQLARRAKNISHTSECLYNYRVAENVDVVPPLEKIKYDFEQMSLNIELLISSTDLSEHKDMADWLRLKTKMLLAPAFNYKRGWRTYQQGYQELNYRILLNRIGPAKSKIRHILNLLGLFSIVSAVRGQK